MNQGPSLTWIWLLTAAGMLSQATIHLVRPATTYKLIELGADGLMIGLITGIYALLPLVLALFIGARAQRLPSLRGLLAGGQATMVLGIVLLAGLDDIAAMALGSAVLGLGQLMFMLAAQAAVARFIPAAMMDTAFGWFTAGLSGGQLVGPLLGGLILDGPMVTQAGPLGTINLALWAGGLLSLVSIAFLQFTRTAFRGFGPERRETPHHHAGWAEQEQRRASHGAGDASPREILKVPQMKSHMFASIAMLSILDVLSAFMPLLGEEAGITPFWVGVLLSVRAAAAIVSRLLLPLFRRRWNREILVLAALWIAGVSLGLMPLMVNHLWAVLLLLTLAGFGVGLGHPLTMSQVTQSVPENWRSSTLALRLMGNRVGQVFVPIAAGALAAPLGSAGAIWAGCALVLASGAEKGIKYCKDKN